MTVAILADQFAWHFGGFSMDPTDLSFLILGVDRESSGLTALFDERKGPRDHGAEGGRTGTCCGQAPSNYPAFSSFLVECGIDSISLNPDSFVGTIRRVADAEAKA